MTTPPWTPVCVAHIKTILLALFFWESNPERVGKIIRFGHGLFIASCVGLYILAHTLLTSFWFFCLTYCILVAIWLQHMCFGGCIVSFVEQSLIGDHTTLAADAVLDLFDIQAPHDSVNGIVLLCFTIGVCFLTFELMARVIFEIA